MCRGNRICIITTLMRWTGPGKRDYVECNSRDTHLNRISQCACGNASLLRHDGRSKVHMEASLHTKFIPLPPVVLYSQSVSKTTVKMGGGLG